MLQFVQYGCFSSLCTGYRHLGEIVLLPGGMMIYVADTFCTCSSVILFAHFSTYWFGSLFSLSSASPICFSLLGRPRSQMSLLSLAKDLLLQLRYSYPSYRILLFKRRTFGGLHLDMVLFSFMACLLLDLNIPYLSSRHLSELPSPRRQVYLELQYSLYHFTLFRALVVCYLAFPTLASI
jgi:hypothetical protein